MAIHPPTTTLAPDFAIGVPPSKAPTTPNTTKDTLAITTTTTILTLRCLMKAAANNGCIHTQTLRSPCYKRRRPDLRNRALESSLIELTPIISDATKTNPLLAPKTAVRSHCPL
ncbi:hypothetical protein V6N13_149422 [Hibiscus sabdariffa]|uniref:Uncharacterized protein n=1 Tax=Hibiscus sabdariffa TaxID=183260 RepID=A0ABR2EJ44_9ROSI